MSQQNTDLGPKAVELNEMGVLSLTSTETVSYQIIAKKDSIIYTCFFCI